MTKSDSIKDPTAIPPGLRRVGWTDGRVFRFISTTFWHRDESANPANDRELLFFQDFGLRERPLEGAPFRPEITSADIYDVIHATGRFWDRCLLPGFLQIQAYEVVPQKTIDEAVRILQASGFVLPPSKNLARKRQRRRKATERSA